MAITLLVLFYISTPLFILYLCHKSSTLKKIGAVVLAYIAGLIIGNIGILPTGSEIYNQLLQGKAFIPTEQALLLYENGKISAADLYANKIGMVQDILMTIVIPLSIPLLLFSLNLRNSIKTLKTGLLSLIVAIFSLLICVIGGYFLFRGHIAESSKIAGMMVGLYTGGTPNLGALATALDVKPETFILTHTYDLMMGIVLLLFFITIAQRLLNKILPHFNGKNGHKSPSEIVKETEGVDNFIDYFDKKTTFNVLKAFGISVLIFATGGGISLLVPPSAQMVTVILTITTLGILVSLSPKINRIDKTFELGMYLILIFSIVVASMANFKAILNIDYIYLFLYVILAVFGSMIIHIILSTIFKIDTDSTIITITALSTSPPFVPVVAGALKNKDIIIMGITIGVIGYAIGNYLGIGIAVLLEKFTL